MLCEVGGPTVLLLSSLKPIICPIMPARITVAAVMAGMPPMLRVISSAIGLVTDLAASESTTSRSAPSHLAKYMPVMMPVMLPANCEVIIGSHWLRIFGQLT